LKKLHPEWHKQRALLVAFPHQNSDWVAYLPEIEAFYVSFIKTVAIYQKCIVLCDDIERVSNLLGSLDNIELKLIATNDTWIRDYGPIADCDFGFNGWGLKFASNHDNSVNQKLFANLRVKNMILEGGSIDYNGDGVVLTTSQCLLESNRNPAWNRKKIERKLKQYLGIKSVVWLENGYLAGDDTDSHIDTLARFIDTKTIVYTQCSDESDEHFEALKKMEDELIGSGFALIALPLPQPNYYGDERLPATYCNFVFVNDAVIVPTYDEPNDAIVLDIFKKHFPQRDIIGLDSRVLIRQHGSIHCASCNLF
jgi:agmatine/peptidylarginine deiminase